MLMRYDGGKARCSFGSRKPATMIDADDKAPDGPGPNLGPSSDRTDYGLETCSPSSRIASTSEWKPEPWPVSASKFAVSMVPVNCIKRPGA
jgi:hypothetical protein